MDRGAWRATIHGVTKSQTQLSYSDLHFQRYLKGREAICPPMAFSASLPLLAGAEYSLWLLTGILEEGHMGMGLERGPATKNLPFTSLGLWGPVTVILCHGNSSELD